MKLLLCLNCHDSFKLPVSEQEKGCRCGESGGRYLNDGLNAEVSGNCVVIGLLNQELVRAIQESEKDFELDSGGIEFKAFVIPEPCSSITRKK